MRILWWGGGIALLLLMVWVVFSRTGQESGGPGPEGGVVAAVEVEPVRRETIELRRIFTGTLESPARFVVAPKVGGRVERLAVDLADPVENGQVVAELDDEEYQQETLQSTADLEVARANLVEAKSNLEIALREMDRVNSLVGPGFVTDAQVDTAKAQLLTREAAVEVAKAQVTRAEATLARAKIRLGYTAVTATWSGGGTRFVAERFINEGGTVVANTPLMAIVELDPIIAVVFVTEKDYGLLRMGQPAAIMTDAFPAISFPGRIARVAPVFNRSSRQARVEIELANSGQRLKPGMFVQAEVLLDQAENATVVPLPALATRGGQTGVFVVDQGGDRVTWRPVETGIRHKDLVQVHGQGIEGRVVTMGHQLIDDGSPITIPEVRVPELPEAE